MLVNQNIMTGLQRSMPGIGGPNPEFPTQDFNVENNPEFGANAFDGLDQGLETSNGRSFADFLTESIDAVSQQDRGAMKLGLDFALGRGHIDVHQVMIEQAKAEAQLHLTSAVTNKMASGYQTLMNMQI